MGNWHPAEWSKPFTFWNEWENLTTTWPGPGVYVVYRRRPIRGLGGVDRTGVLYVGQSSHLAGRLKEFVNCHHPASDFLWCHLPMARLLLGRKVRSSRQVERMLERLTVRVAAPIRVRDLGIAEQSVLFAYLYRYGEMPPLNLSLPGRWKERLSRGQLNRGGKGLQLSP